VDRLTVDGVAAVRVGVLLPTEDDPRWARGATWCALLEAWGVAFETVPSDDPEGLTTFLRPEQLPSLPTWRTAEDAADEAFAMLEEASPDGLVALARWPGGARAGFVVDGDVDHPTGVDPECSRYVAPAIETARRARFGAYGIFATASNVEAEPAAFPPGAEYYNHSYTHPYSHWNPAPWESLSDEEMAEELRRSDATFRARFGADDHGIFRLPHFQWEAWARSAEVLDRLGYLAESSVGANHSLTGGLPYRPAAAAWSDDPADAPQLRTHPDPTRRRSFLELPISTDPSDPAFPNGCCSYNTLGEGVRSRTADPADYEAVLRQVLDRAVGRGSLCHVFIDPPDAGYGRLEGDTRDYAGAVERWLADAVARDDLAIMTTAGLAAWWRAREEARTRMRVTPEDGGIVVTLDEPPPGAALSVFRSGEGWTAHPFEEATR
jgi:peptidoglycan/xylan/chitin deacetylase (PgdA/CDA1 family)